MIKLKNNKKNNFLDIKTKEANNIKIGKLIQIKNSQKTFQVVGLNHKRNICWVREWPLKNTFYNTFEVSVNNIFIPTISRFESKNNH